MPDDALVLALILSLLAPMRRSVALDALAAIAATADPAATLLAVVALVSGP